MEIEIKKDALILRVFPDSHLEQSILQEMILLAEKGATVKLLERDKGVEVVVVGRSSMASAKRLDYEPRGASIERYNTKEG